MNIEIAYPYVLYVGAPILFLSAFYRYLYHKTPTYLYSSLTHISKLNKINWHETILYLLRIFSLLFLILAAARIKIPDLKTKLNVNGIDIILALDLSYSMHYHGQNTNKAKIDIAKQEAIKFVEKRKNDSIGLVLFGKYAISRCPLTQDKKTLTDIILNTEIGQVDPDDTFIITALLTSINRLKYSEAKSKIIILLTDGISNSSDKDPQLAIDMAKKLNIKIYTIGIGDDRLMPHYDPYGNFVGFAKGIDVDFLNNISKNTGGCSFLAKDPKELEKIYNQIDQLEKTEYQAPIYTKYYEYFMLLLWLSIFLLILEILLRSLIWPALN